MLSIFIMIFLWCAGFFHHNILWNNIKVSNSLNQDRLAYFEIGCTDHQQNKFFVEIIACDPSVHVYI